MKPILRKWAIRWAIGILVITGVYIASGEMMKYDACDPASKLC